MHMAKKQYLIKIESQIEQLEPGIYHLSLQDKVSIVRDTEHEVRLKSDNVLFQDILNERNRIEWHNIPSWGIGDKYWEKLLRIIKSLSNDITITSNVLDLISKIVIEGLEDKSNVVRTTRLRMLYEQTGDDISKTLENSFSKSIEILDKYNPNQDNTNNPVPFHEDNGKTKGEPISQNATTELQKIFQGNQNYRNRRRR